MQALPKIRYEVANLSDVGISTTTVLSRGRERQKLHLNVNGVNAEETKRFWHAFNPRFGITENFFRHFSHAEVFNRIVSTAGGTNLRFAIDESEPGTPRLLGVAPATSTIIRPEDILSVAEQHGGETLKYRDGVVSMLLPPLSGHHAFSIGGDDFKNRFQLSVPVDGFGKPTMTLALLRLICANGLVASHNFFRTEINMGEGKDPLYTINRAVGAYDDDKAYDIIARRIQSAQHSMASVEEAQQLHDFLVRIGVPNDQMGVFRAAVGNVVELYGVANSNAISKKRRRQLPSTATVYDLINFATELSTHHMGGEKANVVGGYIGKMVTEEFDLEGSLAEGRDFRDLFLQKKAA